MAKEIQRSIEQGLRQEQLLLTPDFFYNDNHSFKAQENRNQWEEARIKGEIIAWMKCSDARIRTAGINAALWRSIAGADEPDAKFTTNRAVTANIALAHFDGDTVAPGQMPYGCGGLGEKEKIDGERSQTGIYEYIYQVIKHPDMLIQALHSAENMAIASGKQTLAAAQDHLNFKIYPIALFLPQENGEMVIHSKARIKDTIATNYNPKKIYENGIPAISESSLPDTFVKVMLENTKDMQEINSKYPDLRAMQKVQKPRVILLTTDIRPARTKYPTLSSIPGSIFKVIVPREKIEGNIKIDDSELENSLNQLEYPIPQAIKNYNDPTKNFSNTDRLIIETGDIEESRKIAKKIVEEKEWMRNWLKLNDRKILLTQSTAGIISTIEYFKN